MKKLYISTFILLFSFLAFAQKNKKTVENENAYEITVKIKNTTDSVCYLAYHLGDKKYIKDTTFINKKGEFVFAGKEELPGGIYIVYFPNKNNFEIIVNEQKFSFETDTNNFVTNFNTENSVENKVFYDYLKFTSAINDKAMPLSNERNEILEKLNDESLKNKEKEALESRKTEIETILKGFEKDIKDYRKNLFDTKGDLFVVKTFKAVEEVDVPTDLPDSLKFNYYKTHFFDNIDLGDDRMMRTPLVDKKVERYLEKLTLQIPDSVIKEADRLISLAKPNSEMIKYLIITVTNKYGASKIMCMDQVFVHMIDKYYKTGVAYWADSAQLAKLTDRARTLSWTTCDQPAPNLMLRDTNDIFQQLYKVDAKYTIAYFWDPDCGHCKKVTPKLVELYDTFLKENGVKIFAITTTNQKGKWVQFIREKGLHQWINVYDPDYKSGFRQLYDITSTPKVFIMDKDKKIIAKQIGVEQVEEYMRQKIKMDNEKK